MSNEDRFVNNRALNHRVRGGFIRDVCPWEQILVAVTKREVLNNNSREQQRSRGGFPNAEQIIDVWRCWKPDNSTCGV